MRRPPPRRRTPSAAGSLSRTRTGSSAQGQPCKGDRTAGPQALLTIHAEKFFRKFLKPSMCSSGKPYFTSAPSRPDRNIRARPGARVGRFQREDVWPACAAGHTFGRREAGRPESLRKMRRTSLRLVPCRGGTRAEVRSFPILYKNPASSGRCFPVGGELPNCAEFGGFLRV